MENLSQVAVLVSERIRITGKKQLEIAEEVGFQSPNIITMIKQGKAKLPIAKVGRMANALDVDPLSLLKLCLEEYQPDAWMAIFPYFEELVTKDELTLVKTIRSAIGGPYLAALSIDQRAKLDEFVFSMREDVPTIQ